MLVVGRRALPADLPALGACLLHSPWQPALLCLQFSTHQHFLPSVALASLCLQLLYRHCLPSVVPVAACAPSGSQQCCACRFLHTCSLQTLAGGTIGKNTRISDIMSSLLLWTQHQLCLTPPAGPAHARRQRGVRLRHARSIQSTSD